MIKHRTYWLVLVLVVALLVGCSGKDKQQKKSSGKSRAPKVALRVDDVRKQIDDLEHSLVQVYQETEIQQMKIRAAQEHLAALRKSLGDLAKTSLVSEQTTAALKAPPVEIPKLAEAPAEEQPAAKSKKKEHENRALETLLLVAFLAFLGTFGYKLYQHRKAGEATPESGESESSSTESYTIIKPDAARGESEGGSGVSHESSSGSENAPPPGGDSTPPPPQS
jgi:uncharacterized protein HemX